MTFYTKNIYIDDTLRNATYKLTFTMTFMRKDYSCFYDIFISDTVKKLRYLQIETINN